MSTIDLVVALFFTGLMLLGSPAVLTQDYPIKPIRILAVGVGGGADTAARLIAQGVAGPLGQQLIIDNRPSIVIAGEAVAKAPPDGYTLIYAGSNFYVTPLLQPTPYDPIRDFSPVTAIERTANILVVHASLPVKSVKDLIALAKARPGQLNYASSGVGGADHLGAELFKYMAAVDIVRVPYKSGGAALTALISGEVHLTFTSPAAVASHVKSGRLRALAVTGAKPSALLPGLPTVAASGVPGYEAGNIQILFAPAKTPEAVVKRLNQEVLRYLNTPEAKEQFLFAPQDVVGNSPEESAAKIKAEIVRLSKLIKDVGIRAE